MSELLKMFVEPNWMKDLERQAKKVVDDINKGIKEIVDLGLKPLIPRKAKGRGFLAIFEE